MQFVNTALPKKVKVPKVEEKMTAENPYYGQQSCRMQFLITSRKGSDNQANMYNDAGGPNGIITDFQRSADSYVLYDSS